MATSRGKEAKQYLEKRMASLFGNDYIGVFGDKTYLWGKDSEGNKVQVAITMTCPKAQVEAPPEEEGFDWSGIVSSKEVKTGEKTILEPTQEEKDNIAKLVKNVGL